MGKVPRKPRVVKFQTRTRPTISWSTNMANYIDDLENKITYELSDDDKEERLKEPGGPRVDPPKIKTETIRMPDLVVTGKEVIKETNIFDEKTELYEDIMENHPDNWDEERLDYEPESKEEEDSKDQVPNSSKPKIKRLETPRTVDFKGGNARKIKSSTPKLELKDCMTELNEVFADESGSADDTTYEREFKEETTKQVEQTLEVSQPEGITRPIVKREVIFVSEVHTVEDNDSDVEEVHDDGEKRFRRSATDGYIIRRPRESFDLRKRLEKAKHRTRGCRIGETSAANRTLDKESSKNSIFCTPATRIESPNVQKTRPAILRTADKHQSKPDHMKGARKAKKRMNEECNEYEEVTSGEEETLNTNKKSWSSTQRRPSAKSRLNCTNKFKIPRVEYETEERVQETQEMHPKQTQGFESLTTKEVLVIAGSSDHLERLGRIQNGVKDAYREIVVKLIRRTGIMCKVDMDPLQRHIFKGLAGDFRRQVLPRPPDYNPGKDTEGREA